MKNNFKQIFLTGMLFFLGCAPISDGSELGRNFYKGELTTQDQRISTYSLPDQWEIYYYGKTSIHPPDFTLSRYLARNGESMAVYILDFLNSSKEDMYFLNSLDVFVDMKSFNYFDYCKNKKIIDKLNSNKDLLKNENWRKSYNDKRLRMDC